MYNTQTLILHTSFQPRKVSSKLTLHLRSRMRCQALGGDVVGRLPRLRGPHPPHLRPLLRLPQGAEAGEAQGLPGREVQESWWWRRRWGKGGGGGRDRRGQPGGWAGGREHVRSESQGSYQKKNILNVVFAVPIQKIHARSVVEK